MTYQISVYFYGIHNWDRLNTFVLTDKIDLLDTFAEYAHTV